MEATQLDYEDGRRHQPEQQQTQTELDCLAQLEESEACSESLDPFCREPRRSLASSWAAAHLHTSSLSELEGGGWDGWRAAPIICQHSRGGHGLCSSGQCDEDVIIFLFIWYEEIRGDIIGFPIVQIQDVFLSRGFRDRLRWEPQLVVTVRAAAAASPPSLFLFGAWSGRGETGIDPRLGRLAICGGSSWLG